MDRLKYYSKVYCKADANDNHDDNLMITCHRCNDIWNEMTKVFFLFLSPDN